MITVLIADDNDVVREGLVALLQREEDMQVVATARNGEEAVHSVQQRRPDVTVLDVRMPRRDGVQAAVEISALCGVLMLTYAREGETVTNAIRAGACGYLVHGDFAPAELADAVRRVADGRPVLGEVASGALTEAVRRPPSPSTRASPGRALGLSDRECEVMDALARGLSNAEIARRLVLTEKTVKNHLNRIYAKLDVACRTQAVARWLSVGDERGAQSLGPCRT